MKPVIPSAAHRILAILLTILTLASLCSCSNSIPQAAISTPVPVFTPSPVPPSPVPTPVPVITADDLGLYESPAGHYFGAPDQSYDVADLSDTFSRVSYWEEEYMELTFKKSGKTYLYANVPLSLFTQFINADSLGSFYNREFKGNPDYYVDGYEK